MPSQIWRLEGVLDLLERIDRTMGDRSYAFILGAGASVSSGIPSGKSLAQDWLNVIHKRECMDDSDVHSWLKNDPLDCKGNLNYDAVAEFYPKIFERCFRGDHDSGYAALEAAMDGKTPGIGYSFLAEIIATTRHKVVVTTNFDNLVADALAMHAHQSPRIVGHEALAGFVRPYSRRPLIAKIHRDLLFSPINDQVGVGELSEPWKNALRKLFQHYTPIFIGYGGNDGSLMGLLDSLQMGEIAGQMIWCYRDEPPRQALDVLDKHNGIRVKITDFDEFMLQLAGRLIESFDAFSIANRIKAMGDERSESYRKLTTELHASLTQGNIEQKQAGALLAKSLRDENGWWNSQIRANEESDFNKRNAIYKEAIKQFPTSAELHGNYANFLADKLVDSDLAEITYKKALELDPKSSRIATNYARFLGNRRKDLDLAESMYKNALELDPKYALTASSYAIFLENKRGDIAAAEIMYQKALELDPTSGFIAANYANFLAIRRTDVEAAHVMYKRALELAPKNGAILGNYAIFLSEFLNDIDGAELAYKHALTLSPNHANILGNYAHFLCDFRAEIDAAEAMYQKALQIEPKNSTINLNYADFLLDKRGDADKADTFYEKIIEIDPYNTDALVRYAAFLSQIRNDNVLSEAMLKRALSITPNERNICANYAALLLTLQRDQNDLAKARELCDRAIINSSDSPSQVHAEALLYLCLHAELTGTDPALALRDLKSLLATGYRRGKWDFTALFNVVFRKIPNAKQDLYRAVGSAILDKNKVAALDTIPAWKNL